MKEQTITINLNSELKQGVTVIVTRNQPLVLDITLADKSNKHENNYKQSVINLDNNNKLTFSYAIKDIPDDKEIVDGEI